MCTPSLGRDAIAADIVLDRNIYSIPVLVDAGPEVAFETDAFDDVVETRALPEEYPRRLPRLGQYFRRSDLDVDVEDVFIGEMKALGDVHVTVIGHAGGFT